MIDDTNYADCLALYNFNHVDKIKGKKSFPYIFNNNINYIRSLYNRGKLRNITYDTIKKTILCGSIYLGYDLFVCLIVKPQTRQIKKEKTYQKFERKKKI